MQLQHYYRLTKPGIIYGNLLAAAAGFLLASTTKFNATLFIATMLGIALVIAASCVLNNYTDIKIDKKMSRTKHRALVVGAIKPQNALLFGAALGVFGFIILAMWTNWLTVFVGIVGVIDYVVLYAYAKRHSVAGTLVGTVSGSMPPVAGYVAVTNKFDVGALLLFLVMVFWQMAHFYAIAMFQAKDYKSADMPVFPVVKGMHATKVRIVLYICAFITSSLLLPIYGYGGYSYAIVLVVLGSFWLAISVRGFRRYDDVSWARKVFRLSLLVLLGFSAMVSLANVLP